MDWVVFLSVPDSPEQNSNQKFEERSLLQPKSDEKRRMLLANPTELYADYGGAKTQLPLYIPDELEPAVSEIDFRV